MDALSSRRIGRPRSISASVSPWTPSSKPRDCRRKVGGLALLESILGFHTPQIAHQILELSALSPEELAKKADGAIKGFVEKWAGERL